MTSSEDHPSPKSGDHDSTALFDEPGLWSRFAQNPHLEERTRIVGEMIPPDARTLLDVGCGTGDLLESLRDRLTGVGIDPSLLALRSCREPRACALGEALPIRSASVDLVVCLEVLEHLPDAGVRACAAELDRVASRWLLVATPDGENPARNSLHCPQCGGAFNRSHHLQSFDAERFRRLFDGFEPRLVRRGGQAVRGYPAGLLWMRHRIARKYFKGPGETSGLCPHCGNREFPAFRHNLLSFLLDGINRIVSPRRPYWVFMLLERRQAGRIGAAG
jgi:SAM-dependent methyltransferase